MKKITNKIICFLSVPVLCVPVFCFNVVAENSLSGGNPLKSLKTSLADYYFDNDIDKQKELLNFSNVYYYCLYKDYSIPFSEYNPLFSIYKYSGYSDINGVFCNLETLENLYYISFSSGNSISTYKQCILYSDSPIYLIQNNSYITFTSSTSLCYGCFHFEKLDKYYQLSPISTSDGYFAYGDTHFSELLPIKYNTATSSLKECLFTIRCDEEDYSPITWDNIYSNCGKLDTSLLPNVSDSNFRPFSLNLSDFIDVKLTPEFGYDMDRVFDQNTGQNDYFKFEVTNNSDKAIQWSACIYDPSLITSDSSFFDGFSNWKYMCRESYYASSVDEDKGIFRTTWTYDGVLNVGSFDYHLLNPGETFSDIIYWENIKINANKIYTFNVNAFYTDLKYPTMVINPAVTGETSDLHSVVKCTDDYYKTILHYNGSEFGYRSFESSVFSCEFSVLNIPDFTTVKKGGNSVVNTSGNDAYYQQANYETQSNLNGTDTKINRDYVDPTILANLNNRLNVDVDLDNFSIDDVKDYITSCQSFFALIKEALLSFPAFIWALICFGLTGLIVIGIVKALL